jgi:hypothetical protein
MLRRLIIGCCGPDCACRYFLKDGEGNFWNEKSQTWTTNVQDAGLWADSDEISQKMHDLMTTQIPGESQIFVAPVVVEVKSEGPVDLVTLQQWLDKAVQVFMDAQHGTGPGQCMVMLHMNWNDLKENNDESNP